MDKVHLLDVGGQSQQTPSPGDKQPAQETKTDLKGLLRRIQREKE